MYKKQLISLLFWFSDIFGGTISALDNMPGLAAQNSSEEYIGGQGIFFFKNGWEGVIVLKKLSTKESLSPVIFAYSSTVKVNSWTAASVPSETIILTLYSPRSSSLGVPVKKLLVNDKKSFSSPELLSIISTA